jgi:DNA polymerase III subunit delta
MGVQLLSGDDESILRSAVHDLVHQLVGDADRTLMVDEFDGAEYELRSVVDAAQTAPFLTDRRVVVARGCGRFATAELAPLLAYLDDPLPSTELVLVAGGGRLAKALTDAVRGAGGTVVNTSPPARAKERHDWVLARAREHGLGLEPGAAQRIASWLGEDMGRLDGILSTLLATYGTATKLGPNDVVPFLGDAGGVPPWDFTDAIDKGDTTRAIELLHRMMGAGERHPLQIMAVLHGHYAKLARLDGVDARTAADAAAAMGIKPGFPAEKALGNYRRLGGSGVLRAFTLLADADLNLRGDTELSDDVVMEVLVARLSKVGGRR